jgi:tRNA-dihydrouridine synthase 1
MKNRHGRDWLERLVRAHHPDFDPMSSPMLVVAPMVDQSELPFRLQCRKYGAHVCFTPMIHSRLLVTSVEYRKKFLPRASSSGTSGGADDRGFDRPLIAQLCGHDPQVVLEAAQLLAPHCDGIDLNCGCPQGIARRGHYGAFLLEQPDVLLDVVKTLVRNVNVPVSVKVRLLPGSTRDEVLNKSLELYRQLVDAGVAMLTVHGRTRHNKGHLTGAADWDAISRVVQEFSDEIPIVANGGVGSLSDALQCWKATGADAVMSSEAILERPSLFAGNNSSSGRKGRAQLAREYLELAIEYPSDERGQGSGLKCARMHVHRMLHADLQELEDLRRHVGEAASLQELLEIVDRLEAMPKEPQQPQDDNVDSETTTTTTTTTALSWYMRHRQIGYVNGRMVNMSETKRSSECTVPCPTDLDEDNAECFVSLFEEEVDEY